MEAELIPDHTSRHDRRLYRLSAPYEVKDWEGNVERTVDHVVTSAASPLGMPETYVFPANAKGEVIDWSELPGSFRGELDHDEAIRGFLEAASR